VWTGVVERIEKLAESKHLRFSIYGDDITFSSGYSTNPFSKRFFTQVNSAVCQSKFFQFNKEKTRLTDSTIAAPKITGVVITQDENQKTKLTLPQKTLNHWRREMHRVIKILQVQRSPTLQEDGITLAQTQGYVTWIKDVYQKSVIPPSVREEIKYFDETALMFRKWERLG